MDLELLSQLRALEVALHQPVIGADATRLEQLLHPRFREFGRSGGEHSRDEVLAHLVARPPTGNTRSGDYRLDKLSDRLALLTYRSAHVTADGTLERHSLRASLWEMTEAGWQLRFHQGTPTDSIEARSND